MDLLLALLLGLLVGLACGIRGRRRLATWIVTQLQPIVATVTVDAGQAVCVVCGRPANPVRFHDGRFLCSAHKRRVR